MVTRRLHWLTFLLAALLWLFIAETSSMRAGFLALTLTASGSIQAAVSGTTNRAAEIAAVDAQHEPLHRGHRASEAENLSLLFPAVGCNLLIWHLESPHPGG